MEPTTRAPRVADGGYSAVLSASQSTSSPPDQMSSPFSQAMTTAVAAGAATYFMEPPPMPPIRVQTNGVWSWVPWKGVYGPQPLIEVPIPRQFLSSSAPLLSRPVPSSPGPWTARNPTAILTNHRPPAHAAQHAGAHLPGNSKEMHHGQLPVPEAKPHRAGRKPTQGLRSGPPHPEPHHLARQPA